jgi:hypothetical protein
LLAAMLAALPAEQLAHGTVDTVHAQLPASVQI